jgi:hypothetical protein
MSSLYAEALVQVKGLAVAAKKCKNKQCVIILHCLKWKKDTKHSLTSDEAKFCWSTLKSSIYLSKKNFKYMGGRGYMFRHTTIYPTLHFFCSNTAPKQGKPNICYFALS